MFCPNCGAQVGEDELFCGNCGTRVRSPAEVFPPAGKSYNPDEQPAAPRRRRSPLATVGIVLLVLILVGGTAATVIYMLMQSNPPAAPVAVIQPSVIPEQPDTPRPAPTQTATALPPTPTQTFTPVPPSPSPTATQDENWIPVSDVVGSPTWLDVIPGNGGKLTASNGTLLLTAGSSYVSPVNASGPHFEITGDFGVSATVETGNGDVAGIAAYGALPEDVWWKGIKRIDINFQPGKVAVAIYEGASENMSLWQEFPMDVLSGKVQIGFRKVGNLLIIRGNGRDLGQINDPGLFTAGNVYLGINAAPGNKITVYTFVVEAPNGLGVTIK